MTLDTLLTRLAGSPKGGLSAVIVRSLMCLAPWVLLRLVLMPVMAPASGMTVFVPAVMIASLWAGWRGGVLTTLLSGAVSTGLYVLGVQPGGFDMERYLLSILLFGLNVAFAIPFGVYLRVAFRGLTEARATEQSQRAQLRESEGRFRSIAENAPVMLWMGDPSGGGVYLNRLFRDFWGDRSPDQLLGMGWLETVPEAQRDRVRREIAEGAAAGQPFTLETEMRRSDGEYRLIEATILPRFTHDQNLKGIIGVAHDVTEARRVANTLRASEERFRQFAENAPVMLWMGDTQGQCLHLNKALREFWGAAEDLSGFDWAATIHPDDRDAMFAVAGPATAAGQPFDVEARYRRADGAWRIMTTHAQPRYGPDGAYEGMTGVNVDVTDAREAEAALRESEQRFRTMADSAPAPIWISDKDSGLLFGNRALIEMLGGDADPQSVLGKAWIDRVHPEDKPAVWAAREAAHPKRLPYGWDARFRRADGTWSWIRAATSPRFDEQGEFLGYVGIGFDITAAREAEDALRESEARFRAMADSAPSPVWVSGPQGGIEFSNQAMVEFVGDRERAEGLGWLDILHPDEREAALELRDRALREQKPFSFEARFRNAQGQWRWMRASTQPRFGADGEFAGYVGIAFDVTDTREATQVLRQQERRHAFLLELGDQLRDLETPGQIMTAATRLLGQHLRVARAGYGEVDEDETHVTVGADWTDGSVPSATGAYLMDDFGPALSHDLKARKTVAVSDVDDDPRTAEAAGAFSGLDVRAFLRVPLVRSGRLRAFLFLHTPERRKWSESEIELAEDVADRVWSAVERASAEAEVKESEARFRSIADSAPVLIWVTRADRRRAFVNQAYVEFHGGTYEDALTADWRQALHPEDVDRVIAESVAGEATGEPFMLEARYRRQDGAYRWLRSYSRPRFDAEGQLLGFVGVAYDVTDAKRVESDLLNINEILEARVAEALAEKDRAEAALMHAQRMEAVGRLTGGVAHDFNNLLTVVIGALDMVSRATDDPARRERLIDAALAAARRGERLTHQLLAFSRRQALRPQVSDLNALIGEGEPLLQRAVGEAVALDLSLEPGALAVNIDPAHFEAALINLIVNARDATPDGGRIEVSTRTVRLDQGEKEGAGEGDYVLVQVRDTGVGMPPEVQERVFEPFFTTKAVGKGTGLGLSQVYGFVRQSGGVVEVDSVVGKGTTVSLYLPTASEPAPDAPERRARESVDDKPFKGVRVLLVEDDPDVATICEDMLSALGLEVTRAADAGEALKVLRRRTFDLLLTDLIMPGGVNGVELARQVVADRPEVRVLLASGYAGDAVDRALADAPWPLLSKPYDAEGLRRALTNALSKSDAD
ncbi:PAS domain S-box protein [Brevundimonas sp.]|uniref:PAS domain S-box protein n=1 Tax=Brevundimonas sp. TaxID=1871086 RepID=UPI0025F0303E|nr:PAS domain S-box protein [Brevundimonas sp.]